MDAEHPHDRSKDMIEALKRLLKPRYVYKSSVTGRYVSKKYAEAFPDQTYRERV